MKEEEIIEGNKLIAEFMGERVNKYHKSTFPENMKYHSLWDWLMPVVEKIEVIGFCFFIHNDGAYIRRSHYKGNFPDLGATDESKILATWNTVIDYIKWYNSQKQEQESNR